MPKAALLASSKLAAKPLRLFERLRPHQRQGCLAAVSTDGFALFFEQRTGKTWVTGAVIEEADDHDVLLVGPKSNLESTWGNFLKTYLPHFTVCRSLDEYLEHKKAWKAAWGDTPDYVVLLINYEQLPQIDKKLARIKWDRVVYDEAQRLKNRTSKASKSAYKLRFAKNRLALTGTPQDLGPKDIWAIMRFVQPDALGTVWREFDAEFLVQPKMDISRYRNPEARKKAILALQIAKRKAPMRADRLDRFARYIAPHCMRVTKEEAGIKPATIHKIDVAMDGKQRELYDRLERTMIAKLPKVNITTALKITRNAKLHQITGGFIMDEDKEVHWVGDAKKRALIKFLNTVDDEPVAIFCKYLPEMQLIQKVLHRMGYRRIGMLHGKVKDKKRKKERADLIARFQAGKLDAIICQQKTGGVGIDLYYGNVGVVYSMGHSFIDYAQMISRLDFLDKSTAARFFLLVVTDSIDADIFEGVTRKKSIENITFDRIRKKGRDHGKGKGESHRVEEVEARRGRRGREGFGARVQVRRRRPGEAAGHQAGVSARAASQSQGEEGRQVVRLEHQVRARRRRRAHQRR